MNGGSLQLTGLEALRPAIQPNLTFLRLHTDEGLAGVGEAFFTAAAVEATCTRRSPPSCWPWTTPGPSAVEHGFERLRRDRDALKIPVAANGTGRSDARA